MASSLEILGVSLGVISLTFQLFDDCVKGYHFLGRAVTMPSEHRHLSIRIRMEDVRFRIFAKEAGLWSEDKKLSATLWANKTILLTVFAEIKTLLDQAGEIHRRYSIESSDISSVEIQGDSDFELYNLSSSLTDSKTSISAASQHPPALVPPLWQTVGSSLLHTGQALRKVVFNGKCRLWTFVEQEKLVAIISRLAEFNSFLTNLLNEDQRTRMAGIIEDSNRELIQVRDDVQELKAVLAAMYVCSTSQVKSDFYHPAESFTVPIAAIDSTPQIHPGEYFRKLVEFKMQYSHSIAGTDSISAVVDVEPLDNSTLVVHSDLGNGLSLATLNKKPIWIEWRDLHAITDDTDSIAAENQLKLLVDLICNYEPNGFGSPACLGYISQKLPDERIRFGLVYKTTDKIPLTRPKTLYKSLTSPKPSLSNRIALCVVLTRCLYNFHTIGWLHKGLRSENVVFLTQSNHSPDFKDFALIGLQISRPDILEEMTLKPKDNYKQDIYRHPGAQASSNSTRYHSVYDIYSLALLLIEIINWKPLTAVLGRREDERIGRVDLQNIQNLLINDSKYLDGIGEAAGDVVQDVVRICLTCDATSRKMLSERKSKSFVDVAMLRLLRHDVLARLQTVSKAIGGGDYGDGV